MQAAEGVAANVTAELWQLSGNRAWETSQMMRCGTSHKKSQLEKAFSCCLWREVTLYICNGPTFFPMSLLATQRRRSHMRQAKFFCLMGQQDTGTACPAIVQISSHILSFVEPQCSVTDFSFWTRKGHLEVTCFSPLFN